jgi:hypothetical protein
MTVLNMTRGDTFTYTVTLGSPALNLTNCTLWFTIKPAINLATDANDASALVANYWASSGGSAGITVATPSSGVAVITVAPAVTTLFDARRSYVWDVQMQTAAGAIQTIDSGSINVVDDVTRRTSVP